MDWRSAAGLPPEPAAGWDESGFRVFGDEHPALEAERYADEAEIGTLAGDEPAPRLPGATFRDEQLARTSKRRRRN